MISLTMLLTNESGVPGGLGNGNILELVSLVSLEQCKEMLYIDSSTIYSENPGCKFLFKHCTASVASQLLQASAQDPIAGVAWHLLFAHPLHHITISFT